MSEVSIPTYYATESLRAQLRAAATRVVGTPFFANSEAPGPDGGMDCVHLLNWIHRTCGAVDAIEIPRQTMDHGLHQDHSLLIEAFETWPGLNPRFARLPDCLPANLLPGDTLCFRQGHVPHHGSIYLGAGEMIHILKRDGAHFMALNAAIRGRRILGFLAAAYRPLPR